MLLRFRKIKLLDFGWKYAVVVLAVCVFSCALFGILYRPLTAPQPEKGKDHEMEPLRAALSKIEDDDEVLFKNGKNLVSLSVLLLSSQAMRAPRSLRLGRKTHP